MNNDKPKYELRIVSDDLIFLKALEYTYQISMANGSCELKEMKQ